MASNADTLMDLAYMRKSVDETSKKLGIITPETSVHIGLSDSFDFAPQAQNLASGQITAIRAGYVVTIHAYDIKTTVDGDPVHLLDSGGLDIPLRPMRVVLQPMATTGGVLSDSILVVTTSGGLAIRNAQSNLTYRVTATFVTDANWWNDGEAIGQSAVVGV